MLRAPLDFDRAMDAWDATCGPYAMAAATGLDMADIRDAAIRHGFSRTIKLRNMKGALESLGFRCRMCREGVMPTHGICLAMARGPWEEGKQTGIPFWMYTHWVAMSLQDGNLLCCDTRTRRWTGVDQWWKELSADWLPKMPGANGSWRAYRAIEIVAREGQCERCKGGIGAKPHYFNDASGRRLRGILCDTCYHEAYRGEQLTHYEKRS